MIGEKHMREPLTDEEWEMIEIIRETRNKETGGFRLLIELKDGAWEIELKSGGVPYPARGVGADFNQAWSNVTGTIF
jgi:hypothetical protein